MQIPQAYITQQISQALAEDIGSGDVTAALIAPSQQGHGRLLTREAGVLCGCTWFDAVFQQLDSGIVISWQAKDGDVIAAGQTLCTLDGPAAAILTGERTAMNFLQTLSGTASITHQYVQAMGETRTRLLDTRKTIPGLRLAQKYAVHCGGGHNHRIGLYDMVLIKENHIVSCGSLTQAVKQALQDYPQLPIEVEVESLIELQEALAAGAPRILLDNFTLEDIQRAVTISAGKAELEISGNVTLDNIAELASTGVDYISCGAITKHVRALDLSLRITHH